MGRAEAERAAWLDGRESMRREAMAAIDGIGSTADTARKLGVEAERRYTDDRWLGDEVCPVVARGGEKG